MKIKSFMKNRFILFFIIFFLISCSKNIKKEPVKSDILTYYLKTIYKKNIHGRIFGRIPNGFKGHINFLLKLKDKKIIFYDPIVGKSFTFNFGNIYNVEQLGSFSPQDILNIKNYKITTYKNFVFYSYIKFQKELFRITFYNNKLYEITFFAPHKIFILKAIYRSKKLIKIKSKYLSVELLENE